MTLQGALLLLLCVIPLPTSRAAPDILYRVPEEQPPNSLIGSLAADQGLPDSGHLYKLEVGAPYLRVDGKTGDIYTTEVPIDRETLRDCRQLMDGDKCFLEFEVSITDMIKGLGSGPRLIEGRIEVLDVNDNTPQFSSPILTLSIPENTHVGALFSIPMATDRDAGSNGVAEYSLSAGADADRLFSLQVAVDTDEKLPQLVVMGTLDREVKDSYDLNVRVVDGGRPPRASSALLRVTVTDQNDNAPKFERSHYEAELPENSPMGHSILQVRANDADTGVNSEIEYSLHQVSDAVQRLLRIDRSTGVVYVKGLVDREEESILKFFVVARDRGPNAKSSKVLVTLAVRDQNDNAPAIEIRGIGLVTHHEGVANISEDMPVGTPVALVQVSDRDEGENAVVTCVVAGDVPFQLRPASESANDRKRKYFLQTTTLLDYERVKDYRIEIVAVDSGNPALSSTNSLKVQVTDINDNTPVFSPPLLEVDFYEGNQPGDKILDVVATDADSGSNAELVYSLDAHSARLFEINGNSGELRVRNLLDREEKERYEIHVTAADKGVTIKTGTSTVIVHVLDRNDNDPKFMLSGYSFSVIENMPPLNPVGMVTVTDADKGDNARVQLFVEPDNGRFLIQNGTGTILSSISFDREKESTYTFRLKAVDAGDPPRSSYVGVTINVLDENDNAPYVTKPANSSYKYLAPGTPPDTQVEVVEAEDLDSGPNAELEFSITGGNPYGLFHIAPASGEITLAQEFSPKHNGLHRLVVQVKDTGKPARHTTALVHVFVNDTVGNVTLIERLVGHSLYTPLDTDIAGDPEYARAQRSNIVYGILAGVAGVILVIVAVVVIRHRLQKDAKSGYQAGKKESKDLYAPKQGPKNSKGKKSRKPKAPKPAKPLEEDEEAGLQKTLNFNLMNDTVNDSPRIHLPLNYPPNSPDLGRHYRSNSPLPSIQLQPQSPSASKKHQAVQDLPATNTFVGTGDTGSTGSDQYSDYSYKTNPPKYSKQMPHRRVTFSTANQAADQDPSHGYYDSGLEESETPSSKSSSGPRLGPLALPEEHYERTTPDGSIGEMEHPENDLRPLPDVAMTGNCTRECTEFGHSDACWMPGQPSPGRKTTPPNKLSTFVPYPDVEQDPLANGSSRPPQEERGGLGGGGGVTGGPKVANMRFMAPYSSAYSGGGGDASGKDCALEEIPLSQAVEYHSTNTPAGQSAKREIYL